MIWCVQIFNRTTVKKNQFREVKYNYIEAREITNETELHNHICLFKTHVVHLFFLYSSVFFSIANEFGSVIFNVYFFFFYLIKLFTIIYKRKAR